MKQHLRARSFRAILFDIDNTLYRDDHYAQWQIDVLIEHFAAHRNLELPRAQQLIQETRETITARTGRRPSLGNTMEELGVSIAQGVDWRRELVDPHLFLHPDPELSTLLDVLGSRFRIAALTNNPADVGWASLEALGIAERFPLVIGLDTTWHSKPDWEPFAAALKGVQCGPEETLMVGDRFDVDVAPMLDNGGSGIIVERRDDLFLIPDALEEAARSEHR
jgi:FMN phosphatase YigB (HAD superfamily)